MSTLPYFFLYLCAMKIILPSKAKKNSFKTSALHFEIGQFAKIILQTSPLAFVCRQIRANACFCFCKF